MDPKCITHLYILFFFLFFFFLINVLLFLCEHTYAHISHRTTHTAICLCNSIYLSTFTHCHYTHIFHFLPLRFCALSCATSTHLLSFQWGNFRHRVHPRGVLPHAATCHTAHYRAEATPTSAAYNGSMVARTCAHKWRIMQGFQKNKHT